MQRHSLLLTAPRQLAWVADELSEPGPGEALVVTTAGAVSIGTELPHYLGVSRGLAADAYPMMTGYESVGRVAAAGAGVPVELVGQRVVAFYGHRTAALVAADKALPVPDDIPDDLALLAILSCDVMKGVRKLAPQPGQTALVTGAGTIGLLAVWTLATLGVTVDALEPDAARRALALRLGARRAAADPAALDTAYPLGVECSSRDVAFAALQARMAQDGRLCVVSDGNLEPLTLTPHFHARELTIVGSSDGWDYPAHAAWFWPHARPHAALTALYGWRVRREELPEAFARLAAAGRERPVKVLVEYGREQVTGNREQ
jgi:alcohol dehydrogenase